MERTFLENLALNEETIAAILAESQKEEARHQNQMADMVFQQRLEKAIGEKKGRSMEAIRALLDVEALKGAQDPEAQIRTALDELKRDKGFLFEEEALPPVYAPGAGTGSYRRSYTQEELGKMSMAEYRAYRNGR